MSPRPEAFDVIVIGSGAGGGTIAHALSSTSARILLIERGDFVPQEDENWSPEAVWKDLRYRTRERWVDDRGREFPPYAHYSVGGNTKFWGSVLYRLRREDFGELQHIDGVSPAWPITYETLAPYYDQAEQLYEVHGDATGDPTEPPHGPFPYDAVPHAPRIAEIVEQLRDLGLHPSSLPLGIREGCVMCRTCNSFACKLHAKSEADVCCVRPALQRGNVELWRNTLACRLVTDPSGRRVVGVEIQRDGAVSRVDAPVIVVSCGAVNSAALLLRSATDRHPEGLANSSGLVGRRYMAHLATMMQGFHPGRPNPTDFQKTVAINDYYLRGPHSEYPLGQIQSQGRTHAVMAQTVAPWVPLGAYDWWVSRGVDWLAMSEDLPTPDNRVFVDGQGRIHLHYRPNNLEAHRRLVRQARRILRQLGFWTVMTHSHGSRNTTHQCGTVVFGHDSRTSVLDPFCRAHDVENLFVVDSSFFPSSAAVNPALTIIAQALRVADHLAQRELGSRLQTANYGTGHPRSSTVPVDRRPKPVAQ